MRTVTSENLTEAAKRVWSAEAYAIQHAKWANYESQQRALYATRKANEKAHETVAVLGGLTVGEGLADLKSRFDQSYLRMAAYVVTRTRGAEVRTAYLDKLNQKAKEKWDAARQELADEPTESRDAKYAEIQEHVDEAMDFLDKVAEGKLAFPAYHYLKSRPVRPAAAPARPITTFEVDADGEVWEDIALNDEPVPGEAVAEAPGAMESFFKCFGYAMLAVGVGLAVWQSFEDYQHSAARLATSVPPLLAGFAGSELAGPAIAGAADYMTTSVMTAFPAMETTFACIDAGAVSFGILSAGIGLIVTLAISTLLELLIGLLISNTHIPAALRVSLGVSLDRSQYGTLTGSLTQDRTDGLTGSLTP